MEHKRRVYEALKAIMAVFESKVDPQIVRKSLEELRDEIMFLVESMEE